MRDSPLTSQPSSQPPEDPNQQLDVTEINESPSSQGDQKPWRKRLPAFIQQLPFWPINFVPTEPHTDFELINRNKLKELAAKDGDIDLDLIQSDVRFLDYELLRLFRQRDHYAKKHQIKYQRFQILYLLLAAAAGLAGSLQALEFNSNPENMPIYSFIETVIALLATFLATISGRQSPLQNWLKNRQRAEALRREYFRYLGRVRPYEEYDNNGNIREPYVLQMLLARRAADINRGVDPTKSVDATTNAEPPVNSQPNPQDSQPQKGDR